MPNDVDTTDNERWRGGAGDVCPVNERRGAVGAKSAAGRRDQESKRGGGARKQRGLVGLRSDTVMATRDGGVKVVETDERSNGEWPAAATYVQPLRAGRHR